LWMHANAAEEFNTSSAMRDTAKNTTSGAPAQKWPIRTPSTDGKTRTGQRSDPREFFLVGRGVSLPTQTHNITYTHALTRATHAPTHATHALTHATYAPMRATYAPTTYVPGATDWPGPHVHAACLMRPSPISGNIA
jgi:hypothetical protein